MKGIVQHAFKHGLMQVFVEESGAGKTVAHMNANHGSSVNDDIKRRHIEMDPDEIRSARSQVPRIKGSKSHHHLYVDVNENMKLREFSC